MRTRLLIAGLISIAFMGGGTAHAQVGLTGSVSTNGLGLHLNTPLSDSFAARFGFNLGQFEYDEVVSNIRYDAKIKGRTVDALLDYFPTRSGFRLTTGLIYNGNKVDVTGRPDISGTFNFNGTIYTAEQILGVKGRIKYQEIAPYLGIGWSTGRAAEAGWSFAGDLGILYQGSPETTLTIANCLAGALCPQIQNNLNAEARALDREAEDYKYFPIIRIGLRYRF